MLAIHARVTDQHDATQLEAAARDLADALSPTLWLDAIHPVPEFGSHIFAEDSSAVKHLFELIRHGNGSIPEATVQKWIDAVVDAARLLAAPAIDAAAVIGVSREVQKAENELARGTCLPLSTKPLRRSAGTAVRGKLL